MKNVLNKLSNNRLLKLGLLPASGLIMGIMLLSAVIPASIYAGTDDMQRFLTKEHQRQLRWYNLEAGPEWIAGNVPYAESGRHAVSLEQSESILFKIPPAALLRLISDCDCELTDRIRIDQSEDGYVFVEREPQPVSNASWIVQQFNDNTSLVKITALTDVPVKFEIYYSKISSKPRVMNYRKQLDLAADKVEISSFPEHGSQTFERVKAGQLYSVDVSGPAYLQLQMRRPYSASTALSGDVLLNLQLDDQLPRTMTLSYNPEITKKVIVDDSLMPVSRLTRDYLYVPDGQHRLHISSYHSVYLRLLRDTLDNYAYFSLNHEALDKADENESSLPLTEAEWFDPSRIQTDESASSENLVDYEWQQLARDNQYQNSSLYAYNQLHNKIKSQEFDLSADADKISATQYGHYRHLFPAAGQTEYQHRQYHYLGRRLLNPGENRPYHINTELAEKYIKNRPVAHFHPLAQVAGQTFHLPEEKQNSYLRFVVFSEDDRSLPLEILFDNGQQYNLTVMPLDLPENLFQDSMAQSLQSNECCDKMPLSAIIKNTKSVGVIHLPVQHNASSFRILSPSGQSAWLASQFMVSKVYQLDEEGYIQALKQSGLSFQDIREFILNETLNTQSLEGAPGHSKKIIHNHWLPDIRKYRRIYHQFTEGLNIEEAIPTGARLFSAEKIRQLKKQAVENVNKHQWLPALELWSDMARHSEKEQQIEALFGMVDMMQKLGLYTQAEKLLAALSLQADQPALHSTTTAQLLERYKQQKSPFKAAQFLLSMFLQHGDEKYLPDMIRFMVEDGQMQAALLWVHLLEPAQWPYDSVLSASLYNEWWISFEQFLGYLSAEEKSIWSGHRLALHGDYDLAMEFYRRAGTHGENWLQLNKLRIEAIDRYKENNYPEFYRSLKSIEQLENVLSPAKAWSDAGISVNRHAGGMNVLSEDGMRSMYYSCQADTAMELEVAGPAQLQLTVRPLFEGRGKSATPLSASYRLTVNDKSYVIPLNQALPSETQSIENSTLRPGSVSSNRIMLSAGIHRISLQAEVNMLVKPEINQSVSGAGLLQLTGLIADSPQTAHSLTESRYKLDTSPAYKQMRALLVSMQSADTKHNEILARAEKLYADNASEIELQPLIMRIRQSASWSLHEDILQSAGIRRIELNDWQPESPMKRAQSSLFASNTQANRVIGASETIGFSVYNSEDKTIYLNAKLLAPWFIKTQPMHFYLKVDNNKPQKVRIVDARYIPLRLSAGSHLVSVYLAETDYNHFLSLKLEEQNGHSLIDKQRRKYYLASYDEPLKLIIDGPAWIRIDTMDDKHQTHSEYRFVENKKQLLKFKPDTRGDELLLRVFRRTTAEKGRQSLIPRDYKDLDIPRLDTVAAVENNIELKLNDRFVLGKQEEGTYSFSASAVTRESVEDEVASHRDDFMELKAAYRYHDVYAGNWYRWSGLARIRDNADHSLGLQARARGMFDFVALDWDVKATAYVQQLELSTATAARFDASLSQLRRLELNSYHTPRINFFARAHNLDFSEFEFIDADIYTDYKDNHLYGISLSDTLSYQPYVDQAIYAGIKLNSNENIFELDNTNFRVGWRHLLGKLQLDANLKHTIYQKDNDRLSADGSTKAGIQLSWEKWRFNRHRIELRFNYQYDFDVSSPNVRFDFVYHLSEGRDYLDFSNDEMQFRRLKQIRKPEEPNNALQ